MSKRGEKILFRKNLFFVDILKATNKKSRIHPPKCLGSTILKTIGWRERREKNKNG
jgi:hypothetical protein